MRAPDDITSLEQLEALHREPVIGSLLKQIPIINDAYRALIEASPFCVLATSGPEGLDASPRGDAPGFVRSPSPRSRLSPRCNLYLSR